MKNLLLFLILFFSVSCLFSQDYGEMRRDMDAAFQDYMYTLGKDGFYDSKAQEKLEKFEMLKARLEKATSQLEDNTESQKNVKPQSWIRKVINNFKTNYYKKKAINLGKKINKAISNNQDTGKFEAELDKIYSKLYSLNYPDTDDNHVVVISPEIITTPVSSTPTAPAGNFPVDYSRIKKIDFFLSKSISLDKYDVEMILIEFLNFKKHTSRSAMILDFQKANGISKTGQIDDKTKKALIEHLKMIKAAEEKWGSGNELTKNTLPFDKMLNISSSAMTSLPAVSDKNGNRINSSNVLSALVNAESSYIHRKKSGFTVSKYAQGNCGAIGFTQLMPFTAKSLGVNPYDPEDNMRGGARYLNGNFKKMAKYGGSNIDILSKSIAGYNCGPNRNAFKENSWDSIVSGSKVPSESILYTIKIKSTMSMKISNAEKKWMVSHGYQSILIKNGYLNELKRDGYVQ